MAHKILLVDDDPIVLLVIGELLSEHFDVRTAESGADAMRVAQREGPFAVLVTDLCMPEMGGLELLARFAEASPRTVPVVLTAHATLDAAMTAVNESHVFAFFSKDADTQTLADGVRKAAERHDALLGKERAASAEDILSREEREFLTGNGR